MVELVIEAAHGRVAVIAGTGSNSTSEAIDLTRHAKRAGASGALVVNPYYNKPTQEGLYRHFRAVADAVDIPILVYNIAGRTAINVETDTLARLVKDCPNIVGVKEASGSLDQMTQVDAGLRARLLRALRRRQPDPAPHVGRRARRDLRDRQHRPARDRRDDARRAQRRLEAGARPPSPALPALPRRLLRDEPHPHQGGDGHDGDAGAGVPPAHVPDGRRQPRSAARCAQVAGPRSRASPPTAMADVVVAGAAGRMGVSSRRPPARGLGAPPGGRPRGAGPSRPRARRRGGRGGRPAGRGHHGGSRRAPSAPTAS